MASTCWITNGVKAELVMHLRGESNNHEALFGFGYTFEREGISGSQN